MTANRGFELNRSDITRLDADGHQSSRARRFRTFPLGLMLVRKRLELQGPGNIIDDGQNRLQCWTGKYVRGQDSRAIRALMESSISECLEAAYTAGPSVPHLPPKKRTAAISQRRPRRRKRVFARVCDAVRRVVLEPRHGRELRQLCPAPCG